MADALVIGAGPAGLMAAEQLARAGRQVILAEAKPSAGRKLLMAGKSGLNLTRDEEFEVFLSRYGDSASMLRPILKQFDSAAVQNWARDLGQVVFTGSTGRVFPEAMKASPLLRAWLGRLGELGVRLHTRWRWQGWQNDGFQFATPLGDKILKPKVTVLALGGASWSRLGSDGAWVSWLAERDIALTPFVASNVRINIGWSAHMAKQFGTPVKNVALTAGDLRSRGEFVVSAKGLEGGGVYAMSPAIRRGENLRLDLLPDWSEPRVAERLGQARGKSTMTNHLRKTLRLDAVKLALLLEFAHPLPKGRELAGLIKSLPVKHAGLGPIDGAISSAGGVSWKALDRGLMIQDLPGVFAAGEMLDWDAPTGGYLLTGCLATGRWAGAHAARWA